jgi:hypothetical protein
MTDRLLDALLLTMIVALAHLITDVIFEIVGVIFK